MSLEVKVCITALCAFFLTALLTGVWKYRWMMRAPKHQAPAYVDVAHKAALHYSFASLILIQLVQVSGLGTTLNLIAAGSMLVFFATATATYIGLGFSNRTDNQFRERNFATTMGMHALIAGEIGGFLLLAAGVMSRVWL